MRSRVSNGRSTYFWTDIWLMDCPLINFDVRMVPGEEVSKCVCVSIGNLVLVGIGVF